MDPTTTNHLGWRRSRHDPRDHTVLHPAVKRKMGAAPAPEDLPARADLSSHFPSVRNQGHLPSCTAFGTAALLEHAAKDGLVFGAEFASALFIYHEALLAAFGGDASKVTPENAEMGLATRTTFQSFVADGAPPESAWEYPPYGTPKEEMDERAAAVPPAEVYATALKVKGLQYVRLDPVGTAPADVHFQIRRFIAADEPCMLGFDYYDSVYAQMLVTKGSFPYPSGVDIPKGGGHAVVIVGYDDAREVPNTDAGADTARGAYIMRNCWGPHFQGADLPEGYGWLPYAYIDPSAAPAGSVHCSAPVASDVWALLATNWQ